MVSKGPLSRKTAKVAAATWSGPQVIAVRFLGVQLR